MTRIIKILHVTGTLRRGGVETWLSQALIRLPRDRYHCDICIYQFGDGDYSAGLKLFGCKIHFIPRGAGLFALSRFAGRFKRLLREENYDVVHCHGLLMVGFLLYLGWREGVPVRIGHSHTTDRSAGSLLSRAANRIGLMLNRPLASAFSTHGVGCSAEAGASLFGKWQNQANFSVIHCGIDLIPFEGEADRTWRTSLGIKPGARVIGHVSNFSIPKNPLFLVDVVASVIRRSESVVLLLVGNGVLRPAVEERCVDLGISSKVFFTGVSSQVPALMRSAMDVFLMPSLNEGLPLVLLEAQAAGLPCFVSDAVSREAAVMDGSVHFLSLSAGAAFWADAVLARLDSSAHWPDPLPFMRETDFNVVVSARRLAELYEACTRCGIATTD